MRGSDSVKKAANVLRQMRLNERIKNIYLQLKAL